MNSKLHFRKALIATCIATATAPGLAAETRVVSPSAMAAAIAVEIDHVDGTVVSGRVINRSGHRIKDPELAIRYSWLWRNEYKPRADGPGWVDYSVLHRELAPNESTTFTFEPDRGLPARDDGHISPSLAVTRVTQFK